MGGRAVATYLFNDKMQKLKQFMLETSTEMEVRIGQLYCDRRRTGRKAIIASYSRCVIWDFGVRRWF